MARSDFSAHEQQIIDEAVAMEAAAKARRQEAYDLRDARDLQRPAIDRLIFASTDYCDCGHGLAYDPLGELASNKDGPFRLPSQWECSAILLGIANPDLVHTGPLPFAFYEIKSETQPSAGGKSTREPIEPDPETNPKKET